MRRNRFILTVGLLSASWLPGCNHLPCKSCTPACNKTSSCCTANRPASAPVAPPVTTHTIVPANPGGIATPSPVVIAAPPPVVLPRATTRPVPDIQNAKVVPTPTETGPRLGWQPERVVPPPAPEPVGKTVHAPSGPLGEESAPKPAPVETQPRTGTEIHIVPPTLKETVTPAPAKARPAAEEKIAPPVIKEGDGPPVDLPAIPALPAPARPEGTKPQLPPLPPLPPTSAAPPSPAASTIPVTAAASPKDSGDNITWTASTADAMPGPELKKSTTVAAPVPTPAPVPEATVNASPFSEVKDTAARTPARTEERAGDHTTLTGKVQQWRNSWRLRYAAVDAEDPNGGSVTLVGDDLERLRDGQRIRVRGVLIPADGATGTARYQVTGLEILD